MWSDLYVMHMPPTPLPVRWSMRLGMTFLDYFFFLFFLRFGACVSAEAATDFTILGVAWPLPPFFYGMNIASS